ncbi:hypothetical protein LSTR_LSTR009359 [Laodelphax striatellus]|uniref:Protein CCSMST1 n=1 Tax=Laodelphax striatellus TaxID=195883 RepID=A0A482WNQ0_LAOST|nr:hypothetical protein LSTR_LSTR009359 [Laodelphax striatellus]
MSALRAVFKTHLPLAGMRLHTQTNPAIRVDGCLKFSQQTNVSALSPCRSVSTVQSATDKIKRNEDGEEEEENNEPVKFTTSKAANWRAEHTWRGTDEDIPPIQPMVVSLSVGALLVYFFYLREENDVDQKLIKDLDDLL